MLRRVVRLCLCVMAVVLVCWGKAIRAGSHAPAALLTPEQVYEILTGE